MVSLAKKELFTEGLCGLILIVLNMLEIFDQKNQHYGYVLAIAGGISYILLIISTIIVSIKNTDKIDEMALENYNKVYKCIYYIIFGFLLVSTILFDIFEVTFVLNSSFITLFFGVLILLRSGMFFIYEIKGNE